MSSDDSDYSPRPTRRSSSFRRPQQPYPTSRAADSDPDAKVTRERRGCLSCRLRRKKCPNEWVDNEAPNQPCELCTRLNIECLGWAMKRPKWMRNKAILESMKNHIKEHLSGPVRSTSTRPTLSLAPIYNKQKPSDWVAPFPVHHDHYHHESSHESSNSQHPPSSPSSEGDSPDSQFVLYDTEDHDPTLVFTTTTESSPLPLTLLTLPTSPSTVPFYIQSPTSDGASTGPYDAGGSSHDGTLSPQELPSPELPPDYAPVFVHDVDPLTHHANLEDYNPDPYAPFSVLSNVYPQGQSDLYIYKLPLSMDTPEFVLFSEWHYNLRRFMYRFVPTDDLSPFEIAEFVTGSGLAHDEALAVTKNLIRLHALGSVSAALDAKRDLALQNHAVIQRLRQRSHSQPDNCGNVVAALFGLSFSLFLGGSSGWQNCLEVACRWVRTSWPMIENGSEAPIAKIFAGMTVWFDILGAVTLCRQPMLGMDLLVRILTSDSPVQLESIMGCNNLVMFGIAYIATIAHAKRVRGLEDDAPELQPSARYVRENFLQKPFTTDAEETYFPMPPDLFALPSVGFPMVGDSSTPLWANDTIPVSAVTSAFRAAAHVYLETTVSGCNPYAPGVLRATDAAIAALKQIPTSDADRNLIWPLCVIGCMANRPMDQEYMATRFALLEGRDKLGNGARAEYLVHLVWTMRNSSNSNVDWIDAMGNLPILLA